MPCGMLDDVTLNAKIQVNLTLLFFTPVIAITFSEKLQVSLILHLLMWLAQNFIPIKIH